MKQGDLADSFTSVSIDMALQCVFLAISNFVLSLYSRIEECHVRKSTTVINTLMTPSSIATSSFPRKLPGKNL